MTTTADRDTRLEPPGRPGGRRRVGPLRLLGRLVTAVVLLVLLAGAGLVAAVVVTGYADDRGPADALVVLGTAQYDGRPSDIFRERLEHAADLYEDGVAPRIITVGGSRPGDRFTEAEAARTYLVDSGVPAEDVVAVEEGADTYESMVAVAERMDEAGWDSAVLVSDPAHALRSRTMARDQGLTASVSSAREGEAGQLTVRYVLRESAALAYYLLAVRE